MIIPRAYEQTPAHRRCSPAGFARQIQGMETRGVAFGAPHVFPLAQFSEGALSEGGAVGISSITLEALDSVERTVARSDAPWGSHPSESRSGAFLG